MGHFNGGILAKRAAKALKAYNTYMGNSNGHSPAKSKAIIAGLTMAMQAHVRRAGAWPSQAYSSKPQAHSLSSDEAAIKAAASLLCLGNASIGGTLSHRLKRAIKLRNRYIASAQCGIDSVRQRMHKVSLYSIRIENCYNRLAVFGGAYDD